MSVPRYSQRMKLPVWYLYAANGELVATIRERTMEEAARKFHRAGMEGEWVSNKYPFSPPVTSDAILPTGRDRDALSPDPSP